ncbi:MAG TPA: hypothetical protein VGE45_11455 [Chloroflexia bacterium]|jgi:hypothetical protein
MYKSDEYQTLRQELLDSYTREVNIVTFGFTATAAIIGFGFTTQSPPSLTALIFLVPLLMLALILLQVNNSIYTILTISVYIRVFFEEDENNGLHWERTISDLRTSLRHNIFTRKPQTKTRRPFHLLPVTLLTELWYLVASVAMAVICIALALSYDTSGQYWTVIIMSAILWLIVCTPTSIWIMKAVLGDYEDKMVQRLRNRRDKGTFDM